MEMPEIFKHKKFQAGIVTAIVVFLGQFVPSLAETGNVLMALAVVNWIAVGAPITAAILGQGFADLGKEAEKIKSQNAD